jgi:hypothetical protein
MKIMLGDFNAKVGREDIFKQTIGNERKWHSSTLDNQSFRAEDCDTDHYLMVTKVNGETGGE